MVRGKSMTALRLPKQSVTLHPPADVAQCATQALAILVRRREQVVGRGMRARGVRTEGVYENLA